VIDTYRVVLYIHLLSLFVGIGAGAIMVLCLFQLKGAKTLMDAVPWGRIAGKTGRAFPIAILGLFGTGAYMTSDVWTWSTGWIEVAIAALVVLAVQGPGAGIYFGKKIEHALRENGPGPLNVHARQTARHPGLWVAEFSNLGLVFGVVWIMTTKPGTGGSVAAAVGGYVIGGLLGFVLSRVGSAEPAPVTEPVA
jgi:hypothetical protein